MPPYHLKGWLHGWGHVYQVENGPSLGGCSIAVVTGAGLWRVPDCLQHASWSWACCQDSPESPHVRERRPVTVNPFPCRMQRLPARGLRAACSESWSVEPKGVQQGQVNSRHASCFKRRFWFTASCLCSRYLCLPGALRGTFHSLEIMTDPDL